MATTGARPMGVTQGGGYTAVIEVAQQPDGSFQWTNLNIAAGRDVGRGILRPAPFPALTSGFAAAGWGSDSRRVYYADTDGAVIELKTDGGRWQFLNLTSSLGVPAARWNSPLTTGGMRFGTMMVYYVDEGGGLIVLKSMKPLKSERTWHSDIADFIPTVPAMSPLAALQNARGRFVYFFNKNGHVIEVEGFGKPPRRISDLTKFMKLPSPSPLSGLTATGWGSDHRRIYYADTSGSLIEMARSYGDGDENGRWSSRNLSSQGVRRLKDGSPQAAASADGTLKGVALVGWGSEPLWANWENGWSTQEIVTTAAANSSVACAATTDGRPWVSYVDWNNHLSLWRGPGSDWNWWDLTDGLDLPAAAKVATQGPLALVQTEHGTRIYYLTDEPDF